MVFRQIISEPLEINAHYLQLAPCNVVLRKTGSSVEVSIQDPEVMFSVVDIEGNSDLEKLPMEARQQLQEALKTL